jgi:hypothetical protein
MRLGCEFDFLEIRVWSFEYQTATFYQASNDASLRSHCQPYRAQLSALQAYGIALSTR